MDMLDAVTTIGFPAALALFFVWWTTTQLSNRVEELCLRIEQNTQAVIMLATVLAKERNIDLDEVKQLVRRDSRGKI